MKLPRRLTAKSLYQELDILQSSVHYHFTDSELLIQALTHRSYLNEDPSAMNSDSRPLQSNERLEFLGDAILSHIVTHYLFEKYPQFNEGELSRLRAQMVDANSCYNFALTLNLHEYLLFGRGCLQLQGKALKNLLADLFEAFLGAIFLDGGFHAARKFFFSHFQEKLEDIAKNPQVNWKAKLQTICQKRFNLTPNYKIMKSWGAEHDKHFLVRVYVGTTELGEGSGRSKQLAQIQAAKNSCAQLEQKEDL